MLTLFCLHGTGITLADRGGGGGGSGGSNPPPPSLKNDVKGFNPKYKIIS